MIADQQQERRAARQTHARKRRHGRSRGRTLLDEPEPAPLSAGGSGIGRLVSRADDHADFLDAGREDFLNENPQRGLGDAVAVHQGLQGKGPLSLASGGDNSFLDFHGFKTFSLLCKAAGALQNAAAQSTARRL